MAYSGYFFGNLFGSPIAGILIDKYSTNLDNDEVTERNFLPVMIYSAGFLFIGVLFLLSIRYTVSKKIFVKV
jgi:MFS family permease